MNEIDAPTAPAAFRRGPAFISASLCSLLGYIAVVILPYCFSAPVPGDPTHKFVFSSRFLGFFWAFGLLACIALPVAVWRRKATVAWWTYPLFLVAFCVAIIVFMVVCSSFGVGLTQVPVTTPRPW
jgi:hypothetical protein